MNVFSVILPVPILNMVLDCDLVKGEVAVGVRPVLPSYKNVLGKGLAGVSQHYSLGYCNFCLSGFVSEESLSVARGVFLLRGCVCHGQTKSKCGA